MANAIERWFENQSLAPLRDFSQIQQSFDRLYKQIGALKSSSPVQDSSYVPSCEISEDSTNYLLKFDMPGVTKDHVKVEVDNDQLIIKAERKEEKKIDSTKKYLTEVYYGSYERSFALPGPVDEKKVDAKFENGVLTVIVPKNKSFKTKQIPIQ